MTRPAHRERAGRAAQVAAEEGRGLAPFTLPILCSLPGEQPRLRLSALRHAWFLGGCQAPLTLVSPRCQVCARTMGAALGTGARLALLRGRACGAIPRWAPSALARGCHSKPGAPRLVPLKKRGYDVTRNPHLNKVMVPEGRVAQAAILRLAGRGAPPPGSGLDLPRRPSGGFPFLPCRGLV